MTAKSLTALKKKSKISKKYYANPSMINKKQLNIYPKDCSKIIIDVKNKFLNTLSVKLDDPNTSAKSYWSIINNFTTYTTIVHPPIHLFYYYTSYFVE